jgi:uncharacterized delta-60 repeat protein
MKLKYTCLLIVLTGLLLGSCKKAQTVFDNPYAGGKPNLNIVTNAQQIPVPASGTAGTPVTIAATGLMPHYTAGKLTFLFNGQLAKILTVTETGITVEVPGKASTGVTAFVVDGQVVFGPIFTVVGKVNIDPTFVAIGGTDGGVYKAYPLPLSTQLLVVGEFNNYDNKGAVKPIRRIARINTDGSWDRSFASGTGANSSLYDVVQIGSYIYPVGEYTGYAQQNGTISKITRLFTSGQIDTMQVTTYLLKTRFVPTFNGGVAGGGIRNIYPVGSDKMIVAGNFTHYVSRRYDQNSYDSKDSTIIDSITMPQLARLNADGTLDKTWRFNPTAPGYRPSIPGAGLPCANGPISTVGHSDGKILVYGINAVFTKFDNVAAPSILRLNADGTIDNTFNAGTGPDFPILNINYDPISNKYIVVGYFTTWNGKPAKYMVQLNYDGSIDTGFATKVFDGGFPFYAKILSDGTVFVNGSFRSYDGIARNGLFFTDKTGTLKDGWNTIGNLTGNPVLDVYETKSEDNKRAILIMGGFKSFDSKVRWGIVRATLE